MGNHARLACPRTHCAVLHCCDASMLSTGTAASASCSAFSRPKALQGWCPRMTCARTRQCSVVRARVQSRSAVHSPFKRWWITRKHQLARSGFGMHANYAFRPRSMVTCRYFWQCATRATSTLCVDCLVRLLKTTSEHTASLPASTGLTMVKYMWCVVTVILLMLHVTFVTTALTATSSCNLGRLMCTKPLPPSLRWRFLWVCQRRLHCSWAQWTWVTVINSRRSTLPLHRGTTLPVTLPRTAA